MTAKLDIIPIEIWKDTREPKDIYLWRGDKWRDKFALHKWDDDEEQHVLDVGDYSVWPWGCDHIFVERKEINDYVGSITKRREQFKRMCDRAKPDAEKWLMLEGKSALSRLFNAEYRARVREKSSRGTLIRWAKRYGFTVFAVENSIEGMDAMAWIFHDFKRRAERSGG